MNRSVVRWIRRLAAGLAALACAAASQADSDEAWLARAPLPPDVPALLAIILDSSAATAAYIVVREPYDPARDYGSGLPDETRCDANLVYWRRGAGPAPDCQSQAGLDPAPRDALHGLHCEAARRPLATYGYYIAARAAQWRATAADGYWSGLRADSPATVECRADRGRHGSAAGAWHAADRSAGPWNADARNEIDWNLAPHADPFTFYGGNYLNYLRAARPSIERPISEVIRHSMAAALDATGELAVALIRVNEADGSHVARAPVDAAVAAADLAQTDDSEATGDAPLAEALVEAAAWLSGGTAWFGMNELADADAFEPGRAGQYRSPFSHPCRPITLAYLTAGMASGDEAAPVAAAALPEFAELTGGCDADCLAPLARWIEQADLRRDLPGTQSARLQWLAPPLVSGLAMPESPARLDDPLAFINLVARSLQHDAAIAGGPQLSAAAFLPATEAWPAPQIVFGLTAPRTRARWNGNLLKYGLRAPDSPLAPPTIVDRDGAAAIDAASGLPGPASRSHWSDAPDAQLLAGGAAGRLPVAGARRLQSNLVPGRILDPANRLAPGNPHLDRLLLGLGTGDEESPDDVLSWLAGSSTLGDPGLRAPIMVDDPPSGRRIVLSATHDGLLHAIDADSGIESWAWMPRELLPRLAQLMRNEPTTVRDHGIDGPLVLHQFDPDGDGRIDTGAGEHRWLLFGLGRGGHPYHALDISSIDDPRLLWSFALPDAPQSESRAAPVVTRLPVAGSGQSNGDWVVLIAGGYDREFDSAGAAIAGAGNRLLLLDAANGRVLWQGGGDVDPDLRVAGLTASVPSAPRALDIDGDGLLDRAYLVDIGGGLWRFDFTAGRAADELARARLLARLGTGEQRFHDTPDVSIATLAGRNRIAIAVGSGWLARPRDDRIVDRIYTIFDTDSDSAALTEPDLHDATDATDGMPPSAPGWFRRLDRHGPGEKIVGTGVTFDHVLRLQTYQPVSAAASLPCGPPRAIHRLHAIDVRTGLSHASSVEFEEDEEEVVPEHGLPVALRFGFPERWDGACAACRARPFGIVGPKVFDPGYAGDPVRTSWRRLALPPDSR